MKLALATLFALSIMTTTSHAQSNTPVAQTTLLAECNKTLLFKDSIVSLDLIMERYFVEDSDGQVVTVEKEELEDMTNFRFVIGGIEQTITRSFEWNGMNGAFVYRRNGAQCNTWVVQPH